MPTSEAALFALLGRILAAEIDPDLHATLATPGIRNVFEAIEPDCLEIDLEEAAVEYCRLFILPDGAAPLASAWLPGSDPNRAAPIVGLVYNLQSALDLELPAALPPDHAGVLLPLMGWLLENQADAAAEFSTAALEPWLSQFAAALETDARLPIYRATAKILRSI